MTLVVMILWGQERSSCDNPEFKTFTDFHDLLRPVRRLEQGNLNNTGVSNAKWCYYPSYIRDLCCQLFFPVYLLSSWICTLLQPARLDSVGRFTLRGLVFRVGILWAEFRRVFSVFFFANVTKRSDIADKWQPFSLQTYFRNTRAAWQILG